MVQEKKRKSGLRVVVDNVPTNHSVSFNMYVKNGSGNELEEKDFGISHFIEHMLFKSTKNYSANELNKAFNLLGVEPNAYTTNMETNYYVKVIKPNLEKCVELMSEMFFNHTFSEEDFEKEKQVVLEEIAMDQDNFMSMSQEHALSSVFKNTPYSHLILGYKETIEKMTPADLHNYFKKHYTPDNLILSFAGNITLEEAEQLADKYFQSKFYQIGIPNYSALKEGQLFSEKNYIQTIKNDTEQAYVTISIPATSFYSKDHPVSVLFDLVLTAGMTSPLFQTIREEKGLVYSIYSFLDDNKEGSSLNICFSTRTKNVVKAVREIKNLLNDIKKNGVSEERLNIVKTFIESSLAINIDNNNYLAKTNAKQIAIYNKPKTFDELLNKYKVITLEQLNQKAKELLSNENVSISYVGKKVKENLLDVFMGKEKEEEAESIQI